MRRLALIFGVFGIALAVSAQYQDQFKNVWIEPGSGVVLPELDSFDSVNGTVGVLYASGRINKRSKPILPSI